MATINRIESADVRLILKAESYIFKCGNGRRLKRLTRTVVPEADVASVADYEICVKFGAPTLYKPKALYGQPPILNTDIRTVDSMLYLGSGEGTGRPPGAKILVMAGAQEAYAIMTWSDLFGCSIKESQMGRKMGDGWKLYANKLTDQQLAALQEALTFHGVVWK